MKSPRQDVAFAEDAAPQATAESLQLAHTYSVSAPPRLGAWQWVAYTVGATVIIFVLLNVAAGIVLWARDAQPCQYLQDFCDKPSGIARFRLRMAPLPYTGKHLHVDAEGWRVQAAGETLFDGFSSATHNVFLFGGSTMFGFGVADRETIPAYLQGLVGGKTLGGKSVRVFNLGQPAYGLREEAYLLVDQLKQGRVPDTAVFYDGINEECMYLASDDMYQNLTGVDDYHETDLGYYTVSGAVNALKGGAGPLNVRALPALQLARRLSAKLVRMARHGGASLAPEEESRRIDGHARICSGVYLDNAALIQRLGHAYGFTPVFILQTSGALLPDADRYAFPKFGPPPAWRQAYYRALYGHILNDAPGRGVRVHDASAALNQAAADGQPVFLEWQHLTPAGNRLMALALHNLLQDQVSP